MFTRLHKFSRRRHDALRPTPEALAERSLRAGHPHRGLSYRDDPEIWGTKPFVHPYGSL